MAPSSSNNRAPRLLPRSNSCSSTASELLLQIHLNQLINDFLFPPTPNNNNSNAAPSTASSPLPSSSSSSSIPPPPPITVSPLLPSQICSLPSPSPSHGDLALTVLDSDAHRPLPPPPSPRLCKSYSEVGSLFCFSLESPRLQDQDLPNACSNAGIKFGRLSSLPCKGNPERTCRKPPRPPKSLPSDKAILILRGPSSARRAASEKRRKQPSSSGSSAASTWALIFTFLFATAIIGEDLWSHSANRASVAVQPSSGMTPIQDSEARMNLDASSSPDNFGTRAVEDLKIIEMRKQLRDLWVSKKLDPVKARA